MSRRRLIAIAASIVLPALGCSVETERSVPSVTVSDSSGIPIYGIGSPPAWDDPRFLWHVELERSVRTGEGRASDDPLLFNPQALMRFADGALVVLDAGDLRLALVHPERDSVIARFGRSGQGPGEILSSNGLLWPAEEGTFWLLDPGNQRLTRFSRTGDVVEERVAPILGMGGLAVQHPRTHEPYFWRVFADPASGLLSDSVLRMDEDGNATPFAAMPPRHPSRERSTSRFPFFAPQGDFAPLGTGGVVVGRSDIPSLQHRSAEGELLGILRLDLSPRAIGLSDKPGLIEEMAEEYPPAARATVDDLADRFPLWSRLWAFSDSAFAMEQTRWSHPAGEPPIPSGQRIWRVLSVTGDYAGVVRFPTGFGYPYWIEEGRVLGIRRDELGVASIESYRLSPPDALRRP